MTKTSSKIISVIFGIIAIYFTINLTPDKTKKKFIALENQYSFIKEIKISEKFITDFESSYIISFRLENNALNNLMDSINPRITNLQVLYKNKPVELYGNNCFTSKSGAEYELNLKLVNANSKRSIINIRINENNLPGPTYELLIEREFKWVFWLPKKNT